MNLKERVNLIEGREEDIEHVERLIEHLLPDTIRVDGDFGLTVRLNGQGLEIFPSEKHDEIKSVRIHGSGIVDAQEESTKYIDERGNVYEVYHKNRN